MNWGPLKLHQEITLKKYQENGCPYCHQDEGFHLMQTPEEVIWQCICGHNLVITLQEKESRSEEEE